jgi:hypothetical protein
MTTKPKTPAQRQADMRARRTADGHIRREFYATPKEHALLGAALAALRRAQRDGTAIDVTVTLSGEVHAITFPFTYEVTKP